MLNAEVQTSINGILAVLIGCYGNQITHLWRWSFSEKVQEMLQGLHLRVKTGRDYTLGKTCWHTGHTNIQVSALQLHLGRSHSSRFQIKVSSDSAISHCIVAVW